MQKFKVKMPKLKALTFKTTQSEETIPISSFLLAMDANGIIQIELIEFENSNVVIQFKTDPSHFKDPVIKSISCKKSSVVRLDYPDYYSLESLVLKNSSLTIGAASFFLISGTLDITNSFFYVSR